MFTACILKGPGHTILGNFSNFSTYQMVIEFTKNIKITAQIKHRKAKKGHGWTKLERIKMDCIYLKKTSTHLFLKLIYQLISKWYLHVHSSKIILSCYVTVILQMKDSCSANLTFRAHNNINKIKQNYLKWQDLQWATKVLNFLFLEFVSFLYNIE